MTPSRLAVHAIGGHDFHAIGRELTSIIRSLGGLAAHERVLDAGCGYGRVAVPLTDYLTTGEYAGFDIDARAIRWCRREISRRHPNFRFTHVDAANSYYNPRGSLDPSKLAFPCAGASIDVAIATSLFTHLLPASAEHYVAELARVLKPGGRAVLTFFIFDEQSKPRLSTPPVMPTFRVFPEPYYGISDPQEPELAVAYELDFLGRMFATHGLVVRRVARGGWSLNPTPVTYQDVLVAGKESEGE